jgi:AcrR family transcriptional regulator
VIVDTRGRLLDAAMELLTDGGVEALTLRAIARRTHVSHGAPLKHFPHRAALLSAVATTGFRELQRRCAELLAGCPADADAAERLHGGARACVSYALERPAMFSLMFRRDLLDPSDKELTRASFATFDGLLVLVVDAQNEGWRPDINSRMLTGSLWAGLHGIAQLWTWGSLPTATGATRVDEVVNTLLHALGLNEPSLQGNR